MWGLAATGVSLEEYWAFVGVPDGVGYGINGCADDDLVTSARSLWDQRARIWFANAIAMVEKRVMADRWLGFPVRRTYQGPRQLPFATPFYLGKYLRSIGVETNADVSIGNPLSLADSSGAIADPVTFIVNVTFTDPDELIIYYPGQTKYTIRPSEVTIAGGIATITIPRVRLLKPEYFLNYDTNLQLRPIYTDDAYFLTSVDVVRNYVDTTTGFNLVWKPKVTNCDTVATVTKQLSTSVIRDQRNGLAYSTLLPQSYTVCSRKPDYMEINYMRGKFDRYEEIDFDLMRALVGIVHNYVPEETCRITLEGRLYFAHDVRPLEPPVNLRMGPSTWGIFEAVEIIKEYDRDRNSHGGGML
jgi:hypothetical protein